MKKVDINAMISRWQKAGIITEDQAEQMRQDATAVTTEKSGSRFIRAVMLVGAIALSLGVLLVIASNWDDFGKIFQLCLAVLMPIIPLTFAYYRTQIKATEDVLSRAAGIVGLALVGGTLAIIGQIYNLESDYVSLLWLWFILTVPFVGIFKRTENMLFSLLLLGVTLSTTIITWLNDSGADEEGFIITMTLFGLVYASANYLAGNLLRGSATWFKSAQAMRIGAAYLATIILFITTFGIYAELLVDEWVLLSIIFNLFFVGFLVFVMFKAFGRQESGLGFNMVRMFGIYLVTKYILLFSDMLETGFFLIVGGVIFIVGAWQLEKRKQNLISYMQSGSEDYKPKPEVSEYDS